MKTWGRSLLWLAMSLAWFSASCNKKKKDSSAAPDSETAVTNVDEATVTASDTELQLAGTLALIPAKGQASAALHLADDLAAHKIDYNVRERSTESVEQIGSILCFMSKTQFQTQVNKGPYAALINESECFKNEGGQGDQGQSREDKITRALVNATRQPNKPVVVDLHLPEDDDGESDLIAQIIVAEPASAKNPVGVFRLVWNQSGGGGFIESSRTKEGKIELAFSDSWSHEEQGQTFSGKSSAMASIDVDTTLSDPVTGGRLSTYSEEPKWGQDGPEGTDVKEFAVAFDTSFMRVAEKSSTEVCKNRDDYTNVAHNYSLYDKNTGALKTTGESNLQIVFDSDGKTYHGNASYWGLWPADKLSHGQTVTAVRWADGTKSESAYTVVKAPGKLVKYTANTTTLGALKGVELSYRDNSGNDYRVKYNGTQFLKTEMVRYTGSGEETTPASGAVEANEWNNFNFYVPSLQASINIPSDATSTYTVRYFSGETVTSAPAKLPTESLKCFRDCPKMQPTASDLSGQDYMAAYHTSTVSNGGGSYKTTAAENLNSPMATYSWDSSKLVIAEGGVAFALPSGTSSGDGQGSWIGSGPLVPASAVAAAISAHGANYDGYRAEELFDTYYRWESGTNEWSQFAGLKDADGTMLVFSKPLELSYTHTTANDMNGSDVFDAKPVRLTYGGPGQLWGIPYKYDSNAGQQMPLFTIRAGVEVGDYTIMPNALEQYLKETDAGNCEGLDVSSAPALPDRETPKLTGYDFGDEAEVPVRVMNGEVQ